MPLTSGFAALLNSPTGLTVYSNATGSIDILAIAPNFVATLNAQILDDSGNVIGGISGGIDAGYCGIYMD